MSATERKAIIRSQPDLSIKRQCELLRIPRSSAYYRPAEPVCDADVEVMDVIDRIHVDEPFKGSRRLSVDLQLDHGLLVNRKRVQRLMRVMGITPVYPKPRTTKPGVGKHHQVFPYLLRDVIIGASNHVWAADLTYSAPRTQFSEVRVSGMHLKEVIGLPFLPLWGGLSRNGGDLLSTGRVT